MGAAYGFRKASDLPEIIPVFPLTGALLLPGGRLPLNIFEPRYLNMIDDALGGKRLIGMVQATPGRDAATPGLAPVGCVGRLTSFSETNDGRYLITLTGVCRFGVEQEPSVDTPYRQVLADFERYEHDLRDIDPDIGLDRDAFEQVLRAYFEAQDLAADWESIKSAPGEVLINSLAMICPFSSSEKQALLEAETLADRREALYALLLMGAADAGDDDPTVQ
ncbi:MAG: LON peptidase substrate-binding domain-containing protein [Maricaulaceae bacterium]